MPFRSLSGIVHVRIGNTRMLLATELATCSLVMRPATLSARRPPRSFTTTAISARLCLMSRMTLKKTSRSRTTQKPQFAITRKEARRSRFLGRLHHRPVHTEDAKDAIALGELNVATKRPLLSMR